MTARMALPIMSPPCPPERPIKRRRGEGGRLMAMLDMLMTASRHADAWIEPRVEQVAQQREDCEEGGEYYDHCLDRGTVPPRGRFQRQDPQHLQGEYQTGYDTAADEKDKTND